MGKRWQYHLVLLFVPFLWGAAYPVMKLGVSSMPYGLFLGLRFLVAGLVLLLCFGSRVRRHLRKELLLPVFWVSLTLFADYYSYTYGLTLTSSINCSFYTGISILFIPFILFFLNRQPLRGQSWPAIGIILLGIYLVSSREGHITFNLGDLFCLGSSLLFGLYIVLSSKLVAAYDAVTVSVLQMLMVAGLSLVTSLLLEGPPQLGALGGWDWFYILFLGVFNTALAFTLQHLVQPKTTALSAGIIYSAMPFFGAVLSALLLGEHLGYQGLGGGLLIMAGIILAEISKARRRKNDAARQIFSSTLK